MSPRHRHESRRRIAGRQRVSFPVPDRGRPGRNGEPMRTLRRQARRFPPFFGVAALALCPFGIYLRGVMTATEKTTPAAAAPEPDRNPSAAPLRRTPLFSAHRRLQARMGAFAGWNMPIRYPAGILAEHLHTRRAAALFDVCHMGRFRVTGPTAAADLDRLMPRPVLDQPVGSCRYNFLLNQDGMVRDDLLVYRMRDREFLLVVNAGPAAADAEWLRQNLADKTVFADESAATAKLDLQGPGAFAVLAEFGVDPGALPRYYRCGALSLCGHQIMISRTGYTGERGVEIYAAAAAAAELWQTLLGHPLVEPAGLGARDTLRLEMGYPLYGHELDLDTTPVEAGFARLVSPKDRNFIGRAALARPARKRLTGFRLPGRRAARAGERVWDLDGNEIGQVSSGAFAPSLGYAVALGYLQGAEPAAGGTPVLLGAAPDKTIRAEVCRRPFYADGSVRA